MAAGDGSQAMVVMMIVQASDVSTNQSGALMLSGDVTLIKKYKIWKKYNEIQLTNQFPIIHTFFGGEY